MKITTLTSLFVLLSVVSMVAIAPSAFADHSTATVTNAPGSATPGCEDTNSCFDPNPVTIAMGGTVTWENVDNAAHTVTSAKALGAIAIRETTDIRTNKEVNVVIFIRSGRIF